MASDAQSFKGTLDIAGTKYDVLSCSISFSRNTDMKGRPSSLVFGGELQLSVEITDKTQLLTTMINKQNKAIDSGSITFKQVGMDSAMRKIEFKKAYIINYSEGFTVGSSDPFSCSFTITAQSITVGEAQYEQDWPEQS